MKLSLVADSGVFSIIERSLLSVNKQDQDAA